EAVGERNPVHLAQCRIPIQRVTVEELHEELVVQVDVGPALAYLDVMRDPSREEILPPRLRRNRMLDRSRARGADQVQAPPPGPAGSASVTCPTAFCPPTTGLGKTESCAAGKLVGSGRGSYSARYPVTGRSSGKSFQRFPSLASNSRASSPVPSLFGSPGSQF